MIYTVHIKQQGSSASPDEHQLADTLEVVPETTAKWAIVLPPLWLCVHRLWWPLVIYGAVTIFLLVLLATPVAVSALVLGGLPGLYLYLEGHQLRRYRLDETGYEQIGVVEASSPEMAVERFIAEGDFETKAGGAAPQPSFAPARQPSITPAFGLFSDHGY